MNCHRLKSSQTVRVGAEKSMNVAFMTLGKAFVSSQGCGYVQSFLSLTAIYFILQFKGWEGAIYKTNTGPLPKPFPIRSTPLIFSV